MLLFHISTNRLLVHIWTTCSTRVVLLTNESSSLSSTLLLTDFYIFEQRVVHVVLLTNESSSLCYCYVHVRLLIDYWSTTAYFLTNRTEDANYMKHLVSAHLLLENTSEVVFSINPHKRCNQFLHFIVNLLRITWQSLSFAVLRGVICTVKLFLQSSLTHVPCVLPGDAFFYVLGAERFE